MSNLELVCAGFSTILGTKVVLLKDGLAWRSMEGGVRAISEIIWLVFSTTSHAS